MADDTPIAGETVSKETVEKLKAELAAKCEEAATLRAFKDSQDEKQREVIAKMQPDIKAYVDELVSANADHAPEMKSISDWASSCHQSKSLETAMPLARMISCASAQFKRTREEASVLSEKANTLAVAMKELEETKAADTAKERRINELEQLCNDRQAAAEKLQEELAKAGVLKDKFDFSKLASREVRAKTENEAPKESAALTATTSTASRGKARVMDDELMSFVTGHASNIGSHRIKQSLTTHSHLGATVNSLDSEIASAYAM